MQLKTNQSINGDEKSNDDDVDDDDGVTNCHCGRSKDC